MIKKYFLFIMLFSHLSLANVTKKDIAEGLALQFAKLKRPNNKIVPLSKNYNPFKRWAYNTFAITVQECWFTLLPKKKMPTKLSSFQPTSGGVYGGIVSSKLCKSLFKTGLKPVCRRASFWVKDVQKQKGLPSIYLQTYKNHPLIVKGVITCFLNKDRAQEKQSYVGFYKAEWVANSKKGVININGPKEFIFGTLKITDKYAPNWEGKTPYKELRTTIIIKKPK